MTKKTYSVAFRRRREGKTNYKKRLAMLKSSMPRFVVRKSNRYITVQAIEFSRKGDVVKAAANSRELHNFGWKLAKKNLPASYLTGLLAGVRAKKGGIEKAVLDIGFSTPVHGATCFAALKGMLDSGVAIEHDEKALPSEERVRGMHIKKHGKTGTDIEKQFEEAKNKILKGREVKKDAKGKRS